MKTFFAKHPLESHTLRMGQYGASELIEIHSTTDASTLFKALRSNDPQNRGQKINIWVPSNTRTSRMTAAVPLCTSQ
jgi:hypothetical protein